MRSAVLVLCSMLLTAGCTTLQAQQRRETEIRMRADQAVTLQRMAALEQRVEALETVREMMFQRLDELQAADAARAAASAQGDSELLARIDRERADREQMRAALVQTLSEKIAEIIKSQTPARPPAHAVSGREHVVQSGETLSEIARAYSVRMDAILRANSIPNPDNLKVGQTLFIPE